jgi:lysophospholipase L1-like esterase
MRITEKIIAHNKNFAGTPPVLMAFLGDSVTHGCFEVYVAANGGLDCIYDYESVYHNQLKKRLEEICPASPVNILDAGVSGGSAPYGLNRLDRDILRFSPDFVSVCFGLNDACSGEDGLLNYTNALDGIFKKLKSADIETVFLTPNCMNTYVDSRIEFDKLKQIAEDIAKIQNSGMLTRYIDAAKEICHKNNVPVCDAYGRWINMQKSGIDTTLLLSNHINHPTRPLHKLFSDMLFDMIIE